MTFEQFVVSAQSFRACNPSIRLGQAYYIVADDNRPDITSEIVGDAMYDPFYVDKNINRFLAFVAERW